MREFPVYSRSGRYQVICNERRILQGQLFLIKCIFCEGDVESGNVADEEGDERCLSLKKESLQIFLFLHPLKLNFKGSILQ